MEIICNTGIREILNVQKNIIGEIEERMLRRYGHINGIHFERLPQAVINWKVEGRRNGGRMESFKRNMTRRRLHEEVICNRVGEENKTIKKN